MNILAVSQFYTPDITAAAFRIAETVRYLTDMENEVEVITTFPHKSKNPPKVPSSKNGVHRVQLPDTENNGFLGYIYLYLSFMIKSIFKGYTVGKRQKPNVVWASSPPIFVGLAGWILAKLLRTSFALDIRDIWPDSAVAAGQISDSGFAFKVGKWMEKFLYRNADVVTCVATPMQQYIQQYTDTKVEVVYNGVAVSANITENGHAASNRLEEPATAKDAKKMLYAGNFGHVQQLDLLIEAFAELDAEELNGKWELFFVGGGAKEEKLKNLVKAYDLDKQVHFLGFVPKTEVFSYLKSADALFIHLQDSDVLRLTIPSKVFDYMLADRPLLTGIYGEGKDIIESVEGNFTFKSGNKEDLKQMMSRMDQSISKNPFPSNAVKVKETYSRKNQSKKLNRLLKKTFGD